MANEWFCVSGFVAHGIELFSSIESNDDDGCICIALYCTLLTSQSQANGILHDLNSSWIDNNKFEWVNITENVRAKNVYPPNWTQSDKSVGTPHMSAEHIIAWMMCVILWIAALQCVSVRTIIIIIIVIVIISLDGRSVDATNFITSKIQNGNKHIRARRQNFSYCWRFEQLRCSNSSVVVSRTFEYRFLRSESHHQFVCHILNL